MNSVNRERSLQWIWGAVLFLLALAALVRIGAADHMFQKAVGWRFDARIGWAFALAAACLSAALSLVVGLRLGRNARRRVDMGFILTLMTWLSFTALTAWLRNETGSLATVWVTHIWYQVAIAAVSYQLLSALSAMSPAGNALWVVQNFTCMALLSWGIWGQSNVEVAYLGWKVVNVVVTALLYLRLGRGLLAGSDGARWIVLAGAITAFIIGTTDLASAQHDLISMKLYHHLLAGYMFLMWMVVSGRLSIGADDPDVDASNPNSTLGKEFANASLAPEFNLGGVPAYVMATHRERRRIAQELHDGVGSQLVAIISGLDRQDDKHKALASSLEQCLLDVKILVDAIDDSDECVIDALGRLRYRVQHSLDKLGIRLIWDVDVEGDLEQIRGEGSRQALRIAQESLANVMRHSRATIAKLSCHMDPGGHAMVLEISDNGLGLSDERRAIPGAGKGLAGMARRAAATGGLLEVEGRPGKGTLIRFIMPVTPGPADSGPVANFPPDRLDS